MLSDRAFPAGTAPACASARTCRSPPNQFKRKPALEQLSRQVTPARSTQRAPGRKLLIRHRLDRGGNVSLALLAADHVVPDTLGGRVKHEGSLGEYMAKIKPLLSIFSICLHCGFPKSSAPERIVLSPGRELSPPRALCIFDSFFTTSAVTRRIVGKSLRTSRNLQPKRGGR